MTRPFITLLRVATLSATLGAHALPAPAVLSVDVEAPSVDAALEDIRVGGDGPYMLVRYATDGTAGQRFTGFSRVSALRRYDDQTVLVAEEERDRISAMTLDGRIAWTIPLRRPRSLEVLGPDRFLVSLDNPPRVVEVDRGGQVLWELRGPLRDASGAVRMPDGNTAVVQGRFGVSSVDVFSPDGTLLWSGTRHLAQPRSLLWLPSGELATSGFDTPKVVIFRPFSDEVRLLEFCCHGEGLSVTADGDLLTAAPERQVVRRWERAERILWQFISDYPPYHAEMLSDGTVLVSEYRQPDHACMNARAAAERAGRPLAPYWLWLAAGLGPSLLVAAIVQRRALRDRFRGLFAKADLATSVPERAAVSVARRIEIGAYLAAAMALATVAATHQQQWRSDGQLWRYAALVAAGGICLTLLHRRTPVAPTDWTLRMASVSPMQPPTARMWLFWALGASLVLLGLSGVALRSGEWPLAPWSAGLVLLGVGALQRPGHSAPIGRVTSVVGLLVLSALAFLRLYRLEEYPPNLHLDMAQWTTQTLELMDGEPKTLFANGWAQIPLLGYLWSALWTGLAGRSLAGARFASAVGSLVAIGAAYVLVRQMYGRRAALIAVVLLGVNHGFLQFSRVQSYMDPIPFHVLGVAGLVVGLETGRFGWFALAGLAGGYSALTYHAGRITPPLMALLTLLIVLRYPRLLVKRWQGLLLCLGCGLAMLGPQIVIYFSGRADPFGRADQYAWLPNGSVDVAVLRQTLLDGLPRVLGSPWLYTDASTQYGAVFPLLFPPAAALLGMGLVAAALRPRDVRGLWVVVWGFVILFVGGVLTRDPPFWPRFVTAFVPTIIVVAIVVEWLCRAFETSLGRLGRALAIAGAAGFLTLSTWQNLTLYGNFLRGIPWGETRPLVNPQWIQGIMGRDLQRFGGDAMVFIVARDNIEHSCRHHTVAYYAYEVDVQDAREIGAYLPFRDPRPIVCYVFPEMSHQIAAVKRHYPNAEELAFHDNLGRQVFTRLLIPAPHD